MTRYVGKLKDRKTATGLDNNTSIVEPSFEGRYMHRLKAYAGKTILLEGSGDHFKFGEYRIHKNWLENVIAVVDPN